MPDIYRYFGYVFFFHSNEHDHHESVFDIIMEDGKVKTIQVRQKRGVPPLSSKDQKEAEAFVREYANNIVDKWVNYFVRKKRVVCTNIKKRIK